MTGRKSIPKRTCVACRQVKDKRELVRVIRTPEGSLEIDITGKKEGRGAYLCASRECLEDALRGNKLEHSLRIKVSTENHNHLIKHGEYFPGGNN